MSQPAVVFPPPPFRRRAFDWWLAQVKHALPPTIFVFVGFNLILLTKRLILEEHDIKFSGFFTATLAALLVGKAVLVTDNLPLMRRFDGAPMIQPILFKSAIYWLCVLFVRFAEGLAHFLPSAHIGACCSVLSGVHSRTERLGLPAAKCHPGQNSSCPKRSRPCASRGPSRRCAHDD
jgi:hypothetical protein